MATYSELFPLLQHSELRNKITVAVGVAADIIREDADTGDPWDATNHDNRLIWAAQAYANPMEIAKRVHWAVIVANRSNTVSQIEGATDSQIQDNVNACVDVFATGA